jgi:hypothetical protein
VGGRAPIGIAKGVGHVVGGTLKLYRDSAPASLRKSFCNFR